MTHKTLKLNVRVLATTNRDLREYVAQGRFREDLYYRLNVFPLHIAPLRERREDILPLAELSLRRHAATPPPTLSACAQEKLLAHDWPGNVRELENLIQRTLILLQGSEIETGDLAFEQLAVPTADSGDDADLQKGLRNHEHQIIIDALAGCNGGRAAAAEALGISPRTLRYKLARMREAGIAIPGEENE